MTPPTHMAGVEAALRRDFARMWNRPLHRDPAPTPPDGFPAVPATATQEEPMSFAPVKHDLEEMLRVLGTIVPHIAAVATDPRIDELVTVALDAAGAGVADEVFTAATDALRAAQARKAQPAQQPQVMT